MKRVHRKAATSTPAGHHPIAVVADRTGLSQDVLRVWERRYGAVKPERGPGGQRFYTNADVDRLRLLHSAASAGRSIGQIAGLSDKALTRMVSEDAEARDTRASAVTGPADVSAGAGNQQKALR